MRRFALTLTATATVAAIFAGSAFGTHARPQSATPVRAPLVPAYAPCAAPNSTHVSPLALPACDPPARTSDILTTGSSGQGSGFVKMKVFCLPPETTPPCTFGDGQQEEDVSIDTQVTDVRCQKPAPGCSGGGADYIGSIITQIMLRLSDHDGAGVACANPNGAPPCVNVTTRDSAFGVLAAPGACVPTAGSSGAKCAFSTTMNTVLVGTVKEHEQVVTSALAVTVTDLGEDGDAGPNCPASCGNGDETTFLDTGVFLP
jgi:hypothetical protein